MTSGQINDIINDNNDDNDICKEKNAYEKQRNKTNRNLS